MKKYILFSLIAFLQLTASTTWCMEENKDTSNSSSYRIEHDEKNLSLYFYEGLQKIGHLDYIPFSDDKCHIHEIEIYQNDNRNKGHGTALLQEMERLAIRHNYHTLTIHVHHENRAQRLYNRLGFEQSKEEVASTYRCLEKKIAGLPHTTNTPQKH